MKSNIDTTRTTGANFSCLLCLRRQRLQKIYTSNTVATLKYFNYIFIKLKIWIIKTAQSRCCYDVFNNDGCEIIMWQAYFFILPIGLGIITLVVSLIFLFAYITSNDNATRLPAFNWFKRFIVVAFLLLSMGLFMTFRYFWGQ
ncbi:hypothetical protein Psyc_1694 [Psychrobacter arcticus 273-4]|uniref:Uncharacterized protein n=1 Tax=Psychrobacter arcticus (strain DSM 17307 / VKM B-2377 / 273-4) TaxID=259536 RepID=Q4FR16_PSYA2|nr:hypothetical protein Psyc_1694 [Psychrobacter arcticus 273-4]